MGIIFNSIDEDDLPPVEGFTRGYLQSLPKIPLNDDEMKLIEKFIKPVLTFDKLKAFIEKNLEGK